MEPCVLLGRPADKVIPSKDYRLTVNGEDVFVYQCEVASYAILSAKGPLDIEIEPLFEYERVKVRPLSLGIKPTREGNKIRFSMDGPGKVSVELDEEFRRPLFLLVNPVESQIPDRNSPKVHYFEGGKIYDAGIIELKQDEVLYIEAGAVVYGAVFANHADNIKIMGRGILDGSKWPRDEEAKREQLVRLVGCQNVTIEGITLVDGPNWHVVPIACRNVSVKDLNVITIVGTGDGIDIVGCENVEVDNCFVRSKDDCVAIKATDYFSPEGCKNVENVHVANSVFWNAEWGNALEIGYETRCEEIKRIHFENCDVIRCELEGYQSGGTFTIHNGDRARVSQVLYENIRVEDSREKLIDIKILHAQYTRDKEKGYVRDIRFKNIQVVDGPFPVSIIRGYDGEHMIEDVTIEDLIVHGKKITSANEAKMVVELAKNIRFL